MEKRWARKLAMLLALCLLVNNCIEHVPMVLHASEGSPSSLSVTSGDTEDEQSGNDSVDGGDGQSENDSVDGGDEQNETSTESNGTVQSEASENSIALLSESDDTVSDSDLVGIPKTATEYTAALAQGRTKFYISSYADFITVQNLCEDPLVNGFKDTTLVIIEPPTGEQVWNLNEYSDFKGIGTASSPFQGTIKCYYSIISQSVQFNLATPLFAYLGTGAKVQQLNLVMNNANAAIAEKIVGDVTISDILLSGTIDNTDEGGAAGIIAANIADGSSITLANVRSSGTMTVSGTFAGGIAGTVGSNVNVTFQDDSSLASSSLKAEVKGTTAAGGHYGTVTGSCSWNLADESKIATSVVANGSSCYVGQFAGKLLSAGDTTAQLNITGGDSVTVAISGNGSGGGVVGLCGSNTTITKDSALTINGSIKMTGIYAGGVVGEIVNTNMELTDYTIKALVNNTVAGGVVGQIDGGKYILRDIQIDGAVKGSYHGGGLVGTVMDTTTAAAVELQGTITINSTPTGGYYAGQVVGYQHQCLIYFSEIGTSGSSKLSAPASLEEIGTYGGIYRNQDLGNGMKLIGDGTLANVGVINNTINADENGVYQLTSVADFVTLAIAFGTEERFEEFGLYAFDKEEFTDQLLRQLLRYSSYEITQSEIDISYESTGIITLNRNDKKNDYSSAFSGSIKGLSTGTTIIQDCSEKQERVGFFSSIGSASFENLTFTGKTEYAEGVGGIAYQILDNENHSSSLVLSNVTMKKEFANNSGVIGGVVAQENCTVDVFTLTTNDLTLASTINAGSVEDFSGFITSMDNATVSMTDTVLGGSITSSVDGSSLGGFMGRNWTNIDGIVKGVTVQFSDTESKTTYTSSGNFGALWGKVSSVVGGYLTLQDISLSGLIVNADANHARCSLMIQDATELLVNVVDYNSAGCTVNNPNDNFDEIAGQTKTYGNGPVNYPLSLSGIVSIHSSQGNYPKYHYINQATGLTGAKNNYSMYFYDVFQLLEKSDGTIVQLSADKKLDSLEEMLIWDLLHYANYKGDSKVQETILRKYLEGYTANAGYPSWGESYSFVGTLDLSQISFYPITRVNGVYSGENAVIKFDASVKDADGIAMKEWSLSNIDTASQHYGLQAGLFYDPSKLGVYNVTFTGYIANLGAASGVLACGPYGLSKGTIENVTLDNLWILDYSSTQSAPGAGLLISNIPGSSVKKEDQGTDTEPYGVTFYGITMKNYSSTTQEHAAAALIGSAGGTKVVDLNLDFHNMVIADDIDGKAAADQHNGTVLAYASFIYNYTYTDVSSDYEGHGIYLFSSDEDGDGIVTYGKEIDDDTEFSNNSLKVIATKKIDPSKYKPYVYQVKKIEVNPKSGDILKGCGTYEDPYIIENVKQFLTLYRYINEIGSGTADDPYQYQTFYEGWKVIGAGDDSEFCTTKHRVESDTSGNLSGNGKDDVKTFGTSADFPTPDEMSRAYYQLGADIDLSQSMSTTYEQIAEDFVGFGTEDRPFVGVWYGMDQYKDEDGNDIIHTITLPDKKTTLKYTTYGFIQYAKGAVVKDMTIKTSSSTKDTVDTSVAAQIASMGGGVIACILGGDNIIDNVTVEADYSLPDGNYSNSIVGGYVGDVKKGGLILRNVDESNLENFRIYTSSWVTYAYLGAVVGKVEDGYVIYEDTDGTVSSDSVLWDGNGGKKVWVNTTTNEYQEEELVQVHNYNILNGDVLKANSSGLEVAMNGTDITITIPTAEALQVMSMALNSDTLNVRPDKYRSYSGYGYTENSRSRKANYSNIGNCTETTTDYINAAKYDNVMNYGKIVEDSENTDGSESVDNTVNANYAYAFPYLYQYMNITGDTYLNYLVDTGSGVFSILNPSILINGTAYKLQWNLVNSETEEATAIYDMAQFGQGFRGLGALYQTMIYNDVEYSGTFHGNFNGMGSIIKIQMNKKLLDNEKYTSTMPYAGLFNMLYARDEKLYKAEANFADIDATTEEIKKCAKIENFTLTGQIAIDAVIEGKGQDFTVGGVVAKVNSEAEYIFENIIVTDFEVKGTSGTRDDTVAHSGGTISNVGSIVGYVGWKTSVLIKDCSASNVVLSGKNNVGGLVGTMKDATVLKIQRSSADQLTLLAVKENVGGLVGWEESSTGGKLIFQGTVEETEEGTDETTTEETTSNQCSVTNSKLNGYIRSGGLLGGTTASFSVSDVYVEGLTLYGYGHMGGIVGSADNTSDNTFTSTIQNVRVKDILTNEIDVPDSEYSGIGGIVGRNTQILTIKKATVEGTESDNTYTCQLHALDNKYRTNSYGTGVVNGVGGIVGVHATNPLTLTDCNVNTVSIKTDIKTGGVKTVSVCAGGIVGYVGSTVKMDGNITTTKLNVVAPLNSEASSNIMAAGGCFGYLCSGYIQGTETDANTNNGYYYFRGLVASENNVSGKQAGGVIGCVTRSNTESTSKENNSTNVRLAGVTVTGGKVTSDEVAGGMFGDFYVSSSAALDPSKDKLTNLVQGVTVSAKYAGGVIGYVSGTGPMRLESVKVEDSTIIGKQTVEGAYYNAGGIYGSVKGVSNSYLANYNIELKNNIVVCEVKNDVLNDNEIDHLAVGGIIGRMSASGTTNTYTPFFDNVEIVDGIGTDSEYSNKIGVRKVVTDANGDETVGEVQLVRRVESDGGYQYQLADLTNLPTKSDVSTGDVVKDYDALAKLTEDYGFYVGNMVGVVHSTNQQLCIIRSNETTYGKFETPVLAVNPPVTDVGRTSGQTPDTYRKYCHIVYGASNATNIEDDNTYTNLADMKDKVDKVNKEYAGPEGTSLSELLQEYRLSEGTIELFNKLYEESYTFTTEAEDGTKKSITMDFPILVWKAEYGTIQETMECIADVMTNVAGASAADVTNYYMSITCKQKLSDGTVTDGQASITATTSEASGTTFTSSTYDGIKDSKLSYTEITFTYGRNTNKVFKIPIFVEEPILYGVHSMIVEGRVTDVDTVKEKGISESSVTNSSLIMANDSDYTMLLEYTYGEARKDMPGEVCVDKFFSLEALGEKQIPEGTRLMLIDVTNGNKAYYYTVKYIKDENGNETLPSKVFFSEFQNSAGEHYQSQSINQLKDVITEGKDCYIDLEGHELTEVGVEQFLLTVLAAENNDNQVYTIHTGISVENESLASRFDTWKDTEETKAHNEQSSISVTAIPGLSIAFKDKGTDENKDNKLTDIDGFISKDGNLSIKANIEIKAKDDVYWAKKQQIGSGTPIIDSENNGKYLELAFYLRDKDGNRVKFPSGTNFSYMLAIQNDNTVSYSENKVIPNDSVFYYYKDVLSSFNQDYQYQIGNLNQDTTLYVEFMMDFSGADLSNITDEKYVAWLDLLRTANRNYPMGNGNKLDSYSENVDANASQQLGFAVKAQDLNQLGINTYPKASETNVIDYSVMFDFSDLLKQSTGVGLEALISKWAGYDYTVTYEIYQKTGTGDNVTYVRYTGNDIVLTVNDGVTKQSDGTYVVNTDPVSSVNGTMTVLYHFTDEQLKADNGYISFNNNAVTISTAKLIGESAEASTGDLSYLTNYKIKATLVITASETESAPTTTETSDFFIYTVTKLKTDL